jgi:hypothetical protein
MVSNMFGAGLLAVTLLAGCATDTTPSGKAKNGAAAGSGTVLLVTNSAVVPGSGALPNAAESCAAISQQAENQRTPADIIFAVDNSGSMIEEIGFVRDRLNAFTQSIVSQGVDARIILISAGYNPAKRGSGDDDDWEQPNNGVCVAAPLGSGRCPDDSNPPRYFHVPQYVDSNNALNLIISTFPRWSAQLRPEATKFFVVVSDDNALDGPNNSSTTFRQSVASLPGGLFTHWGFSGIYCFTRCKAAAAIGGVYNQLVSETHGIAGDLCLQNFAPVFDALASAVVEASALACAWNIPPAPTGEAFDRNRVNVQYSSQGQAAALLQVKTAAACGSNNGWHYDDPVNPAQIMVCPGTCSTLQSDPHAEIDVLFGCDTQILPQ